MMTRNEKLELKKKLPSKWSSTLAERTSFSRSYVLRVMKGELNCFDIEKEALKLAEEYQKEQNICEEIKKSIL